MAIYDMHALSDVVAVWVLLLCWSQLKPSRENHAITGCSVTWQHLLAP